MSAGRAARRRAEREGKTRVTYDESNPAFIEPCKGNVDSSILSPEDIRSGRWYFPPFSTLSASGIENCATLLGVHGKAAKRKAVAAINERIRERWPSDG